MGDQQSLWGDIGQFFALYNRPVHVLARGVRRVDVGIQVQAGLLFVQYGIFFQMCDGQFFGQPQVLGLRCASCVRLGRSHGETALHRLPFIFVISTIRYGIVNHAFWSCEVGVRLGAAGNGSYFG